MTIISPSKHYGYTTFLAALFFAVFVGGLVYIFEYNALVNARYREEALKQEIVEMQVKNADLKNDLYTITNPGALQKLAVTSNLVLDAKPNYIESLVR